MTTGNAVLPTQNKEWGFWGTMAHEKKAKESWPLAMAAVGEATKQPANVVRDFLDSKDGRHFADQVVLALAGGKHLPEAVTEATELWMRPSKNNPIHFPDQPADTPYLVAIIKDYNPDQ